jgi:hypothetical protein
VPELLGRIVRWEAPLIRRLLPNVRRARRAIYGLRCLTAVLLFDPLAVELVREFDLDGTLFDRDAAVRALVEEQPRIFAAELASIPSAVYVDRVLQLDAHGPLGFVIHRDG